MSLDTITFADAAKSLGFSPKTLRKRLDPDFKGFDRIQGAVQEEGGRGEWAIPRSETDRILGERAKLSGVALTTGQARLLVESVWDKINQRESSTLMWAAQRYVTDPSGETLKDLEDAIRSVQEWRNAKRIVDEVRNASNASYREVLDSINDPEETGEIVPDDADDPYPDEV